MVIVQPDYPVGCQPHIQLLGLGLGLDKKPYLAISSIFGPKFHEFHEKVKQTSLPALYGSQFLDAIASVGLHMSVCLSVTGFYDRISVMEFLLLNDGQSDQSEDMMTNQRIS